MSGWINGARAWAVGAALTAGGCSDHLPVGQMELTYPDETVVLEIDRVRAQRHSLAVAPDPTTTVHVTAEREDGTPVGLEVTLQRGWSYSAVLSCEGRDDAGALRCDRFPIDAEGDGYTDHRIERERDGDDEIVYVRARFSAEDGGPSEARATFRWTPRETDIVGP